ncbi:hypothetical protein MRX96_012970 [Rhipicephalus microplus]
MYQFLCPKPNVTIVSTPKGVVAYITDVKQLDTSNSVGREAAITQECKRAKPCLSCASCPGHHKTGTLAFSSDMGLVRSLRPPDPAIEFWRALILFLQDPAASPVGDRLRNSHKIQAIQVVHTWLPP